METVPQYGKVCQSLSPKNTKELLTAFVNTSPDILVQNRNINIRNNKLEKNSEKKPKKQVRYQTKNITIDGTNSIVSDDQDYEFFDENNTLSINKYRQKFIVENKLNTKKVKKTLAQLMYCQLMDKMNEHQEDLPKIFRENKMRWCSLMLKTPKLQRFFVDFTKQLNDIMTTEIQQNGDILDHYLKQPRQNLSVDKKLEFKPEAQLATDLYPNFRDQRSINNREKHEVIQVKKSKYNFRKMQQEKAKKQGKFRGMHKHLQNSVDTGKAETIAQAAKQSNEARTKPANNGKLLSDLSFRHHEAITRKLIQDRLTKKPPMSLYQQQLAEKTKSLQEIITYAEWNNDELRKDIDDTEFALEDLEKKRKNKHVIPGDRILSTLKHWEQQDKQYIKTWDPLSISEWETGLWLSRKQFEEQLDRDSKGFEMRHNMLMQQKDNQLERYKNVASMKIQQLESALIELKLKLRREREQCEMTIAEYQSSLLNMPPQNKYIDDVVTQIESGLILRNTAEARQIIVQLVNIVKRQKADSEYQKNLMAKTSTFKENLEESNFIKEQYYLEEIKLRQFYQQNLLKMARELEMFKSDDQKYQIFQNINEQDDDLVYQRQIRVLLEHINLKSEIISHVNKHWAQVDGLKKLEEQFAMQKKKKGGKKPPINKVSTMTFVKNQSELSQSDHSMSEQDQSESGGVRTGTENGLRSINEKTPSVFKPYAEMGLQSIDEAPVRSKTIKNVQKNNASGTQKSQFFNIEIKDAPDQDDADADAEPKTHNTSSKQQIHKDVEIFKSKNNIFKSPTKNNLLSPTKNPAVSSIISKSPNVRSKPSQRFSSKINLFNLKGKKEDPLSIIKNAIAGILDTPVSTEETGFSKVDFQEASSKMMDLIKQIQPDALDNINFLKKAKKEADIKKKMLIKLEEEMKKPPQKQQVGKKKSLLRGLSKISEKQSSTKGKSKRIDNRTHSKVISRQPSSSSGDSDDKFLKQIEQELENEDKVDQAFAKRKKYHKQPSYSIHRQQSKILPGEVSYQKIKEQNEDTDSSSDELKPQVMISEKSVSSDSEGKLKGKRFKKLVSPMNYDGINPVYEQKPNKIKQQKPAKRQDSFESMSKSDHEDAVYVKAEISRYDDPKKREESIKRIKNLNGTEMLTNEIDFLMNKMHTKSLNDSKRRLSENNKLLPALQCIQMQEIVKASIDRQIETDDYQTLYKSDVAAFVENLNKVIRKSFEIEKRAKIQVKETELKPISFADLMKPMFSDCGEILGFELRKDYVMMIYQNSDFDPQHIKRVVKHCLFVNRVISQGLSTDFVLRQLSSKKKGFSDFSSQTDDFTDTILTILKTHLIDLMTRMNPTKKAYYTIVLEEMKLEALLNYKVESVFLNDADLKAQKFAIFNEYLQHIFTKVHEKIQEIESEDEKKNLQISKIFQSQPKVQTQIISLSQQPKVQTVIEKEYVQVEKTPVETAEIGVQTTLKKKRVLEKTQSMLEKEEKYSPDQKMNVAIEEEYMKTMEYFDNYVDFSDKMKQKIDKRATISPDDDEFYHMVQREISPKDLTKAFHQNQIKILINTEEDNAIFSDGDAKNHQTLYTKESTSNLFRTHHIRKANNTTHDFFKSSYKSKINSPQNPIIVGKKIFQDHSNSINTQHNLPTFTRQTDVDSFSISRNKRPLKLTDSQFYRAHQIKTHNTAHNSPIANSRNFKDYLKQVESDNIYRNGLLNENSSSKFSKNVVISKKPKINLRNSQVLPKMRGKQLIVKQRNFNGDLVDGGISPFKHGSKYDVEDTF